MNDISMAGVKVEIHFKTGDDDSSNSKEKKLDTITLDQFSDDGDPIATQQSQIADGKRTMNGELVTWSTPVVYGVTFTLIPGSSDDRKLRAKLYYHAMRNASAPRLEALVESLEITHYAGDNSKLYESVTFKDGRMREGTPVVGSNAEGKALPSTYSFMFKDFDYGTQTESKKTLN